MGNGLFSSAAGLRVLAVIIFIAIAYDFTQPLQGPSTSLSIDDVDDLPIGDDLVTLPTTGLTRYHYNKPAYKSSAPVVVLVHGISTTMDVWRETAAALEQSGRAVLFYDRTGCGYASSRGDPMTIDHMITQLRELLEALDVSYLSPGSIDLIGWSLGTAIASRFALDYPEAVRKLILVAPCGANPDGPGLHKSPLRHLLRVPLIGKGLAQRLVIPVLKQGYRNILLDRDDNDTMLELLVHHADNNPALGRTFISSGLDCTEATDNRATLEYLGRHRPKGATLALWFGSDTITPLPEDPEALMPSAKNTRLIGLGHAAHLTHPKAIIPMWASFLELKPGPYYF